MLFKVVEHESPEEAALEELRRGYDLVVVGVGSEWGLEDRLFGLHRERIISEASTSVLVVRHPASETTVEAVSSSDTAEDMPASNAMT